MIESTARRCYPGDADESDDAAVRGVAVADAEEPRHDARQALDGDAAVDGMLRRRLQRADARRGVIISDRLDDRRQRRRQHADERARAESRPSELT